MAFPGSETRRICWTPAGQPNPNARVRERVRDIFRLLAYGCHKSKLGPLDVFLILDFVEVLRRLFRRTRLRSHAGLDIQRRP